MANQHPLAIMFNDEMINKSSSTFFDQARSEIKNLGVSAIRVYFTTDFSTTFNTDRKRILDRIYTLAQDFDVLVVVSPAKDLSESPIFPTATQTTSLFNALMNYERTGDATHTKLKSVVSKWEIGNEINYADYWKGTGANDKMNTYIDRMLVPAVDVLEAAGEASVSSGLTNGASIKGGALEYFLKRLDTTPAYAPTLAKLDYIAYHPYSSLSAQAQMATDIQDVVETYASGKPILATEWGVNGKSLNNESTWAQQNDSAYKNTARDAYDITYYFCTFDNSDWRDGAHREMGVLSGSPNNIGFTSLVQTPYHWSTFNGWKTSTIKGTLWNDTNANGAIDTGEAKHSGKQVYIDQDGNGAFTTGEVQATTDANGNYTLIYSMSKNDSNYAAPGYLNVRFAPISGTQNTTPQAVSVQITAAKVETGVNFGARTSSGTTGTISGIYYGDANANGVKDGSESGQLNKTIYIDANDNGTFDTGEISASTDTGGAYSFSGLSAGNYIIRRSGLPTGYRISAPAAGFQNVTITAGQTSAGNNLGGTDKVLISGVVYNDTNGDSSKSLGETGISGVSVYVDADDDSILDTGETTTITDTNGNWSLTSLVDGTYSLRVVPGTGRTQTGPVLNGAITVVAANPAPVTNVNFGVQSTAATGSITGQYWGDANGNGIKDGTETAQSVKVMYIDAN
ncbi:MAG TPA: SdrD B-like domain-containing protein, partial [Tepidisphaeraceae bacterium]